MRTTWNFQIAGRMVFGRDAIQRVGQLAAEMGFGRILIVTDPSLVDAGIAQQAMSPLSEAGITVEVSTAGQPDPPTHGINQVVEQAREFRPDALLGLGGGSNMDMSKAAAMLIAHGGSCLDYAGDDVVPGPTTPLILVPTTAGTGSETTAAAVLRDSDTGKKFGVLSNYLRPALAIVDPLLTISCPPHVTADSGIDALSHAIESYTAVDNESYPLAATERSAYQGKQPISDGLAEQAIDLIGRYLRRVVADGNDVEAREGMALAATVAGMAFSNVGVAVVHALEFTVGVEAHIPHGRGCGLLLPYVMRFNKPPRVAEMAKVATLLGEEVDGLDQQEAAEAGIQAVEKLKADIGIPPRLRDVGVQRDRLTAMAENAFALKRILRVNPRTVTQDDLHSILDSAW